jgi:hypothetical protein
MEELYSSSERHGHGRTDVQGCVDLERMATRSARIMSLRRFPVVPHQCLPVSTVSCDFQESHFQTLQNDSVK